MSDYNQLGTSEHGGAPVADNQIEELPTDTSWWARIISKLKDVLPEELMAQNGTQLRLLFLGKSIRMFSFGFLAVMLFTYLTKLGFNSTQVGLLFTFTLLGDACISLYLTSNADLLGRRKMLLIGSALSFATSLLFSMTSSYLILVLTATLGVISPAGSEVGPFMAIELSAISQLTDEETRTNILAWYNLFSSFSNAAGALVCGGVLGLLSAMAGESAMHSFPARPYRVVMIIYCLLQTLKFACYYHLGPEIEVPEGTLAARKASPVELFMGLHKSKKIVIHLCCLFTLDSFAGGFVLQSIVSHWFHTKFDTPAATIGATLFICNILAGCSALLAARIAKSIGLIVTMVVTHLPSNFLTILVPVMPTQFSAILMLFGRFSISQMDVPTRNAYVNGVVDPDERSAANGLTNVTRSIGSAFGPLCAGMLFTKFGGSCSWPFFIAGTLKIVYDLLLLYSMRNIKPASEVIRAEPAEKVQPSSVEVVTFALQPSNSNNSEEDEEAKVPAEDVVEL